PTNYLYLSNEEFENELSKNSLIEFNNFESLAQNKRHIDPEIKAIPDFALVSKSNKRNVFDLMAEFINSELKQHKILISCFSQGSRERLQKILLEHEIASQIIENSSQITALPKNQIALVVFPLKNGFY